MQAIIAQIHKLLLKKQKTVAVAESCTGGLSSALLTQLSGSSRYFILGAVAYSNRVKVRVLYIPNTILAKHGAVSNTVARLMASQIRIISGADLGLGITGIAGPTGGTPRKPVGTVFIAAVSKNRNICRKFNFRGSRTVVRKKAALKSLELLKKVLQP